MPLTGEAKRKYNNARYAETRRVSKKLRPFVGVDGEGGTLVDGQRQEYLLLRAGGHVLETGRPLQPLECLNFLADLEPDNIYVSYFFNYDVTMMVRDLPINRWMKLLDRESRINPETGNAFGVDVTWRTGNSHVVGDLQMDHIPNKSFSVRRWLGKRWGKWVEIHDTGTLFQAKFHDTLLVWFGDDPRYKDIIADIYAGKVRRNEFGAMTDVEREYNHKEVIMLAELMERFRDMNEECGIPTLTKWQGPGNVAAVMFNKYGIPKRATRGAPEKGVHLTIGTDYPDVVRCANDSYYGGRFEPLVMGHIPGPIYQYDINSAYAAMYRHLPCLLHGRWVRFRGTVPTSGPYFAKIRFMHRQPDFPALCTFPIRLKNGTIRFPYKGTGVYTSYEIEAGLKYGVRVDVLDGYRYVRDCDCEPMWFVPDLYAARQRAGKTAKGRVYKLVLASMYGKLAQSVGGPVYSNPVWASLITGYVRAQLFDAAMSRNLGQDVIMLATDGLFCRDQRPGLELGKELGQWDLVQHSHMFVIQSGVYISGDEKLKTRGVPMTLLREQQSAFKQLWVHYLETNIDPDLAWNYYYNDVLHPDHITITRRTFYGLRLARHLNKPELAGTWHEEDREVRFNWRTKRDNIDWDLQREWYYTTPPPGNYDESLYYCKDIGKMQSGSMMEELRLYDSEQPDWAD